jgi:hypothetical protein
MARPSGGGWGFAPFDFAQGAGRWLSEVEANTDNNLNTDIKIVAPECVNLEAVMSIPTDVAKASSAETGTAQPSPLAPGETLEAFITALQAQPLGAEDFLLPREDAPRANPLEDWAA